MEIPRTIDELDDAWLSAALGQQVSIKSCSRIPVGYSTAMYRLEVEGPRDAPASVVVKLPVDGPVRQLLDGIGAYVREVTFYSELAQDVPVRVPKSYVAELARDSTDFVLVLEDLSGLEPANQLKGLTLELAETAVVELAKFHAWSWNHERLQELADRFPPLDSEKAAAVYGKFAQFFAMSWQSARELSVVADEVKEFGDRWSELLTTFVAELSTPRTIAHGELRADNLFLLPDGGLLMIDFQTVAQQAGIVDVAYLVAQSLPVEVRRGNDERVVRRYVDTLATLGVPDYDYERAWRQYRVALAFNLMLPGLAFMQYENTDDYGKQLLVEMLRRTSDAIEATGALELLGARPQC
jgi:Ecdysteroid kinase-like family